VARSLLDSARRQQQPGPWGIQPPHLRLAPPRTAPGAPTHRPTASPGPPSGRDHPRPLDKPNAISADVAQAGNTWTLRAGACWFAVSGVEWTDGRSEPSLAELTAYLILIRSRLETTMASMRTRWATAAVSAALLASVGTSSAADHRAVRDSSQTRFHACRASQLTVKLGHSEAGGGTTGGDIEFANRSTSVCTLSGWPKLVAHTANGSSARAHRYPAADFAGFAVGVDVARVRVPIVVIRPGRRADAIFAAADGPGNRPCGKPYRTLHITAPGTTENVAISAWIPYLDHFLPSCSQIRLSPVLPSADLYKG
jgi:hypothetical protein